MVDVDNEAEAIAWEACRDSGLDDRPRCDPSVMATAYLGLRLCPVPGASARTVGDRIVYPAEARPQARAYWIAHEVGHELALDAGVPAAHEERMASRIGVAVMLPRWRYLRDMEAFVWDLSALCEAWKHASIWIHARRIAELSPGAIVSRWTSRGVCSSRVITPGRRAPSSPTIGEISMAMAALDGRPVRGGMCSGAWPDGIGGAIVVCCSSDVGALSACASRVYSITAGVASAF